MKYITGSLDTSFDEKFESSKLYPWLPWIGGGLSKSSVKTLILGESTYNWSVDEKKYKETEAKIEGNDHLRNLHTKHAINSTSRSPFVRNIERAIFQNKNPKEASKMWLNVAYHNLVLRAMPSRKSRPTFHDYKKGWLTFLDLSATIDIDQCIVYGLEYKKIKSFLETLNEHGIDHEHRKIKPGVGRNYPRVITFSLGKKPIKMLFIRHPSSYFSWNRWGVVLNKEIDTISLASQTLQQTI